MASRAPMIVLDPKFRSACCDGKLKTIIATIESRIETDTKLDPNIFSVMMAEAALNNHVDVVSYCLSNGGSVTHDVINRIVDGLSFETHKFLVEKGVVEIGWSIPRHGDMLQVACWGDKLAWAGFCIHHGADVNAFSPLSGEILLAMTARLSSVEMLNLLLQHGASLHGSGAVVAAAGYGRLDTLSFLIRCHFCSASTKNIRTSNTLTIIPTSLTIKKTSTTPVYKLPAPYHRNPPAKLIISAFLSPSIQVGHFHTAG